MNCSLTESNIELMLLMLLIPGGNKKSYILKQLCSFQLQVCLSTHELFLPLRIKGLINFRPLSPADKETNQLIYKANQLTGFHVLRALIINSFMPFHATSLFLYPPENIKKKQRISDVFRGCKKRPVAWNRLIKQLLLE